MHGDDGLLTRFDPGYAALIASWARSAQEARWWVGLAGFDALLMRVFPDNRVAQKSYLAAGFRMVDAARTAAWNVSQPVDYVWLENHRSSGAPRTGAS